MREKPIRFYALDASRCIAAVGVVFFHSSFSPKSFWSLVDYFFVLSGFVLYPIYDESTVKSRIVYISKRYIYFVRLATKSITLAFFIYGFQYFFEKLTGNIGDQSAQAPGSIWSVPSALLLLQIFSKSSQLLNPPLWSLSAEMFANVLAGVFSFKKLKSLLILYFLLLLLFFYEYHKSGGQNEGVLGGMAIYRVLMGFFVGLITRRLFNRYVIHSIRLRISALPILIVLILSQVSVYLLDKLSLLFLPFLFGLLVLLVSATTESKRVGYARFCTMLGKLSVGIYIFQTPIEPLAAFASDKIVGGDSAAAIYLLNYSVIKVIFCVIAALSLQKVTLVLSSLLKIIFKRFLT